VRGDAVKLLERKNVKKQKHNNLRLRLLSKTKLVILKEGHCLKCAHTGRAESVPSWAYQCLSWGVSKCALFFDSGTGNAERKT
jgi:hypothetical protein